MSRADTSDYRRPMPVTNALRAVLRVEPPSYASCIVLESDATDADVVQDLVDGDVRRCRAEVASESEHRLLEGVVGEGCVCPAFRQHDCVASVDATENGALLVSVSTTDRDELAAIVASLRERGATVSLERASQGTDDGSGQSIELAVDALTEKQRETLRVAVESGYYDRPRRTDLGALADRFGVSRSAVSQRLSAVEAKLVHELADALDDSSTERRA